MVRVFRSRRRFIIAGASVILSLSAASVAAAQQAPYPDSPPGYDDRQAPPPGYEGGPPYAPPPPGYGTEAPPPGYGAEAPPPPPPGYDGSQPPPPPPGYVAGPDAAGQQVQDQAYAGYAQQWAQANCVKARGNTGAGAVIGGAVGALLGSSVAGRHDRGAGAIVGAGVGAVSGAAIANSAGNATSPGCPPGYVVHAGAPAFAYDGPDYLYAAPDWYDPWFFYGGAWLYRPYPYHVWYYRHYRWGRPYYRPVYRGHYGRPRGYYHHR